MNILNGENMANFESCDEIEFNKLCLQDFTQLHRKIEQGQVICPNPLAWKNFYEKFARRADPEGKCKPLILSSWAWATNEEKNAAFKEQFKAIRQRYKYLGVRQGTWQKEIFQFFSSLEGQESQFCIAPQKATIAVVLSNFVQRFRTSGTETISWFIADGELFQLDEHFNKIKQSHIRHRMLNKIYRSQAATVLIERYENFEKPHRDRSYCQFGGCSGIGNNVRPTADIRLKSDVYKYIEKAFLMPDPQIEFELDFTQAPQRAEMSVIFDKLTEPDTGGLTNHFTLDTDAVGGTGLWYADCKLVEITNVSNALNSSAL
jgi:hypothetical protein